MLARPHSAPPARALWPRLAPYRRAPRGPARPQPPRPPPRRRARRRGERRPAPRRRPARRPSRARPPRPPPRRSAMPYVNKRWRGGMLTNFVTIKKRIGLMDQLEARQQAGDLDRLAKKEAAKLT